MGLASVPVKTVMRQIGGSEARVLGVDAQELVFP